MKTALLDIQQLKKQFTVSHGFLSGRSGAVRAVDGVNLAIYRGETLGLVGESGCGKSTLGRLILKLDEPTGGRICFAGTDIRAYAGAALKEYRKKVQIIFQDPYASLNPRKTAGAAVGEPLQVHGMAGEGSRERQIVDLLKMVGLGEEHRNRFPHEFSGGQRQRIGIARALAMRPELIVADEPVSALDVSIQAQILNLLKDLQRDFNLTYLFITHDLSVVRYMSDRIAVMYLGKIVELAQSETLYRFAVHPYTKALLAAIPIPAAGRDKPRLELRDDRLHLDHPPEGCVFRYRCPYRETVCDVEEPPLKEIHSDHLSACHLFPP